MNTYGDTWFEIECGTVVTRDRGAADWLVSWYPHEGDPNYPGFTIVLQEQGVEIHGTPEAVVAWVGEQEWAHLCEAKEASMTVGLRLTGAEPGVAVLDAPEEEWTDLRDRAAEFGWLLGCTREPDGGFSWEVYDPETKRRLQAGVADDWDDARLAMIENLYPPSDEGLGG